jgi:aminomethyltransferase
MSSTAPYKSYFTDDGFSFTTDSSNLDIPAASPSMEREYRALREGIAATDLSSVKMYRVNGAQAVEFLDYLFTGPVVKLREEHLLHTLCVNERGEILTEAYLANLDGDRYLILTDGGHGQSFENFMDGHKINYDVHIQNLHDTYSLFSCDGPYSWLSMKSVFGPEILGLRYLALWEIKGDDQPTYVMRAGKTGEYGYWVMTQKNKAGDFFGKIVSLSKKITDHPFSLYGNTVNQMARMENHFLNLDFEGKYTKNPFELGLFWTIQLDKASVAGEALNTMVENGIRRSVIGFRVANDGNILEGDPVYYKSKEIGHIIGLGKSYSSDRPIGLALLQREYSYVGLTYAAGRDSGLLKTSSMPFLLNKSLQVKIAG